MIKILEEIEKWCVAKQRQLDESKSKSSCPLLSETTEKQLRENYEIQRNRTSRSRT